jgi:hypothetical protein
MWVRFALQQMRLNIPGFSNFPLHFVAGLGKFCRPFHNLLIELTGKALAWRATRWHLGAYSQGLALGSPSENSEKR